jgi:hydrogenase maturation protease
MAEVNIAVFSVGNSLMADDGIAEAVLNALVRKGVPDGIRLINAGGDPLRIAQETPELDLAIVIDSAEMGLQPGEIRSFNVNEASFPYEQPLFSDHGIGLGQVIKIMQTMGMTDRLHLVGVQPFVIAPSPYLSEKMEKIVDKAAGIVLDIIDQHRCAYKTVN